MQFLKDFLKSFTLLATVFLGIDYGMSLLLVDVHRSPLVVVLYAAAITLLVQVAAQSLSATNEGKKRSH